jgi:hypothetical protein
VGESLALDPVAGICLGKDFGGFLGNVGYPESYTFEKNKRNW